MIRPLHQGGLNHCSAVGLNMPSLDAPLLNRIAVRGKMSPFGVPLVM
jgi:hypothetical protein